MRKMVLDAQAKLYLEMMSGIPPLHTLNPQTVRDLLSQLPVEESISAGTGRTEEYEIPVEDGRITVRTYTPQGHGPFPLFVYYHGGGWVIGDLESADFTCRMLADHLKAVVVSVNYRLSPEFKFPIPLEDCYTALKWVEANAGLLRGDSKKVIVGGDSAGGNLAAAVSILARDRKGPNIMAQVLLYPSLDFDFTTESYQKYSKGFILTEELMTWFAGHYAESRDDLQNNLAAPLLTENLRGLPPALIFTAEYDVLRDDGLTYAKRLVEAGIQVEYKCEAGLIHGYFLIPMFTYRIESTIKRIADFLSNVKVDFTIGEVK